MSINSAQIGNANSTLKSKGVSMDSSNLQETLEAIEAFIADKEKDLAKGEALARMKRTSDYKLVFEEGYIQTESKKLFDVLTDPSGVSPYSAEEIHLKLEAISHFKGYVGTEDFPGTIEVDATYAVDEIQREQDERKRVTASNIEDEVK